MKYILITKKGKNLTFFVKSVAETYQKAYGGTVVDEAFATEAATAYLYKLGVLV